MVNKVKIGILGCADIARRQAIPAFQAIDNAEVVSIASRNYEKASKWAGDFKIRAEKSYDALLASEDIDAIYIPLPIGLHREWVLKAAEAGKHIICEKSTSDNLQSVQEMVDACKSNKLVFYENFMCDFHPQHKKVLSAIKNSKIGEPFVFKGYFGFMLSDKNNFRYHRALGGGSLNDVGAYPVFMARKIFDKEPLSVTCTLSNDTETGVDTSGGAILEFPDGQIALIGFSFSAAYQNNYSVWGSRARLDVNRAYSIPQDMEPEIRITKFENHEELVTDVGAPSANQFELIFHDFCGTVLEQRANKKKIEKIYSRILAQAKVMEALRISAKEKTSVKVSEL